MYYLTFFRGDKVCQEPGHQGRGKDERLGVGKVFLVLVKESTLELKVERSRLKVKVEGGRFPRYLVTNLVTNSSPNLVIHQIW